MAFVFSRPKTLWKFSDTVSSRISCQIQWISKENLKRCWAQYITYINISIYISFAQGHEPDQQGHLAWVAPPGMEPWMPTKIGNLAGSWVNRGVKGSPPLHWQHCHASYDFLGNANARPCRKRWSLGLSSYVEVFALWAFFWIERSIQNSKEIQCFHRQLNAHMWEETKRKSFREIPSCEDRSWNHLYLASLVLALNHLYLKPPLSNQFFPAQQPDWDSRPTWSKQVLLSCLNAEVFECRGVWMPTFQCSPFGFSCALTPSNQERRKPLKQYVAYNTNKWF